MAPGDPPLADLRVIDLSTVVAGPACARYLADFGADVIKVERPDGGDTSRVLGWRDPRDDVTLWWKLAGRNKRCIALDLKDDGDRDVFLRLCDHADVLVENFRPGTLERLLLGPDVLHARNPQLVVTRVTGFGQDGPYAGRPGFATIAEAMSGFAAINGEADGGPLLPPIALTDEVTGLVAAFATMVAVHAGVGQVVDVNLLESLFQLMGPLDRGARAARLPPAAAGLGHPLHGAPGDLPVRGRPLGRHLDLGRERRPARARPHRGRATTLASPPSPAGSSTATSSTPRSRPGWRLAHRRAVLAAFDAAHAAIAPVMTMQDIAADEHYRSRGAIVELDGVPMQGLIARLSATPGVLRWAGRELDADGDAIRAELGG